MFEHHVGIDISKANFDVSVEVNGKVKHRQFSNSEKRFEAYRESVLCPPASEQEGLLGSSARLRKVRRFVIAQLVERRGF